MKIRILTLFHILLLLNISSSQADEPLLIIDPHGHSSIIRDLMFTPNGKTLISVAEDKSIRIWDVESGELLKTLRHQIGKGYEGAIHAAALSPNGKTLAIGGWPYGDGDYGIPVYLFNLETGEIFQLLKGHPDVIADLEFSSNGQWLASTSDTTVRFWNMAKPGEEPRLVLESESGFFDTAFSADGTQLASSHLDGSVLLWDIAENLTQAKNTGAQYRSIPTKQMKGHQTIASCVAYSPDGKFIVSGDFDGQYLLWEAKSGTLHHAFPPMDTADAAIFTPDSRSVIVSNGNKAEVYSVPDGRKFLSFDKHVNPVDSNAFSNSITALSMYGNGIVASAGGDEYEIYIWNIADAAIKTHIVGQGKRVEAVAFGEERRIAFGNSPGGIGKNGALERVFDCDEMSLQQRISSGTDFISSITRYQELELQYKFGKWYELKVKGGGTIVNRPSDGWVRSYTFTPSGDVVVGSSQALKLHRADGSVIHRFVGHTGEIWGVSISRDGKILASASDDQTIKLWNLATGENLATLFIARDREWVCWTPQGYYAASAGGEKYIGWQLNQGIEKAATFYPLSVFRQRFYAPQLVKRTIALGDFERAFAEMDLQKTAVTQILPPTVHWIEPELLSSESAEPTMRIQAEILSESDVHSIKVLVNGRAQSVERGLLMKKEELPRAGLIVDRNISLVPGQNLITIFAANVNAGAVSDERIVFYHPTKLENSKSTLYLLSIGISTYQLDDLELAYADDDARAISRIFRSQQGRLYDEVQVSELYDREATQANILHALGALKNQTRQQDVVALFIAAHGANSEGRYYLLPGDGNPDALEQSGVNWSHFAEILGDLPARVLLFLDTCHSGQLGVNASAYVSKVDNTEALRQLSSDEYGVVIMAASTGREFSLEHPDWQHGAFTQALIEGLEQGLADYSQDGTISLRELDLYLAERVEALTFGQQHPTTQKPSTISRFPIVQIPK